MSELYEYLWVVTCEDQLLGNQPAHDHFSNSFRRFSIIWVSCVASFADFEGQTPGPIDINLAHWHVDAAPENHVSAPDVHLIKTVYRIVVIKFASMVIYAAMMGESYPGIRVHNQLICTAARFAKIPLTGVCYFSH